jgi:hypothetical protein
VLCGRLRLQQEMTRPARGIVLGLALAGSQALATLLAWSLSIAVIQLLLWVGQRDAAEALFWYTLFFAPLVASGVATWLAFDRLVVSPISPPSFRVVVACSLGGWLLGSLWGIDFWSVMGQAVPVCSGAFVGSFLANSVAGCYVPGSKVLAAQS